MRSVRTIEDARVKPSPISLIEYFATDLSLTTNRSFVAEKPVEFLEREFRVDVEANRIDERTADRCWQVSVDVRHQPAPGTNFAYSYRVALVGKFGISSSVPADQEERTVRIHGASVLYGMAREIVRALTGRGPYRPVILPTVSFYEQKEQGTAAAPVGGTARVQTRRKLVKAG